MYGEFDRCWPDKVDRYSGIKYDGSNEAELWAAARDGDIFRYAFGLDLVIRSGPTEIESKTDAVDESENLFLRARWLADKLKPINHGE